MAERDVDILIVGGGLAGASCAEGLREEGFDGSVLLVGREPHPPYERPPCSKDLLRGESEPDDAHLHPDDWYADNDIELQTRTSVMKLDPATKTAELAHKQTVHFDRALLATGANINRLRVEGGDHDGIHYLRTLGTSVSLREDAEEAERVVLIGGSYIACEVGGLADQARQAVHARDARGRAAVDGLRDRRRAVLPGPARLARDRVRHRRRGGALRGREARGAGRDGVGQDARRRPRRDRRRRAPRRDAGAQRRARAGGDRRREVLADAGDLGRRASGAPATRASTTPSSTGGGCAWSTSRSPRRRATTPRRR